MTHRITVAHATLAELPLQRAGELSRDTLSMICRSRDVTVAGHAQESWSLASLLHHIARRALVCGSQNLGAFGRAIDLNPLLNPYIDRTGAVQPKNAAPHLDRSHIDAGLLHAGDPAMRVSTDRGWRWGGYWRTPIDYQHFER